MHLTLSGDVESNPGPGDQPLDIIFLNIRGLRNKVSFAEDFLSDAVLH